MALYCFITLMTVCCMLDYVMFDVSRVTCMAGWIEIENGIVINLLVILNNFITVTLVYFTMCTGLDCAP